MKTSVFITEYDFIVYRDNTDRKQNSMNDLENVRSERETETFADFPLSQITFYLVTHNENQRNQQAHQN